MLISIDLSTTYSYSEFSGATRILTNIDFKGSTGVAPDYGVSPLIYRLKAQ